MLEFVLSPWYSSKLLWLLGFRGEDFLEIDQSAIRIAYGRHVC
jgi:hypothetical protein